MKAREVILRIKNAIIARNVIQITTLGKKINQIGKKITHLYDLMYQDNFANPKLIVV